MGKLSLMTRALVDVLPDAQVAATLGPEELGAVLLELWADTAQDSDRCSIASFLHFAFDSGRPVRYPQGMHRPIEIALAEAWSWLMREGLIVRDPGQPASWYVRTRRGSALKTRADVAAFRHAGILPRALLHPIIDQKTWSLFLRGDYDVAVFQAFKTVEVAVRKACEYPDDLVGINLMRKAFHPETGPLADKTDVHAERQAISDLFVGAIGHAKNPQSHRHQRVSINDAAQLLLFASYLASIVDFRRILS